MVDGPSLRCAAIGVRASGVKLIWTLLKSRIFLSKLINSQTNIGMCTLLAELYDLPPTQIGEIYDGKLHTRRLPVPRLSHAMGHFSATIYKSIFAHNGYCSNWWLLNKPEIRIRENVLVPDVAGWQRSTLPDLPENYFETPCVWAAEFVRIDRDWPDASSERRTELFAELGVSYYWLVDISKRKISCFNNQDQRWILFKEILDETVCSVHPFCEEEFDFAAVWQTAF